MTDQTIAARADHLVQRDRIARGFLPLSAAAEVDYTRTHSGGKWVLVVYRTDDGVWDADHFLSGALIPLESRAADRGYGFSRETEDDPTPVSPARVPLHTGFHEATVTGAE
jgi:hypothetical protein